MTDTQHAEIMTTLKMLGQRGLAVRGDVEKLSVELTGLTRQRAELEQLIIATNQRFDE